jgi:hypothetical protein
MEDIIVSYGLMVHNQRYMPTFTGAGQNGTINQSFIDVTLSMGLAQEVTDWCVDSLPSLSDHRNISFTLKFKARSRPEKVTKMGRNFHKANWAKFKETVNTGCMPEIAERQVWTPRHIEAACQKWYSPVLRAFNTVCPSTKIKVRDDFYWWDNDCASNHCIMSPNVGLTLDYLGSPEIA